MNQSTVFKEDSDNITSLQLHRARKNLDKQVVNSSIDYFRWKVSFVILNYRKENFCSIKFKRPFTNYKEFLEFRWWIAWMIWFTPSISTINGEQINENNCNSIDHLYFKDSKIWLSDIAKLEDYFKVYQDSDWNIFFLDK